MNDPIAVEFEWLDGIITNPDNKGLFKAEPAFSIEKELSARWKGENRLGLLNLLAARHGEGELFAVIDAIVDFNCRKDWAETGRASDKSFKSFKKLLWDPLVDAGFRFTHEKSGRLTRFKVTYCPVYEMARTLGAEKWLYHLVCLTDGPSVGGFNPKIRFSRTMTLMEGHPFCDHCYEELSE